MILLKLSVSWLAGIGLAAAGLPQAGLAAVPLGLGAVTGFLLTRRPADAAAAFLAAALFAAGAWRLEASLPPAQAGGVAGLNDAGPVVLRGAVAEEPEERANSQRFVLAVDEVERRGSGVSERTSGRVLVTAREFPRFAYGDRLEVRGRLMVPPRFEGFDYREYLARRGIVSLMAFPEVRRLASRQGKPLKTAIVDARNRLGQPLSTALPEPEASLARGMLLGQRSSIPAEVNDAFNRAGISHLIAISGSNVTLVAGLALAMLTWLLGRRRAVLAAMAFVAGFVALVGASPSVLRAGVMGVMMLGAVLAGRPGSSLTAVAFAAAVLTLWQPLAILDMAFQLSFAATLGLIVLAPPTARALRALLQRGMPPAASAWLSETISVTVAAGVAVFPITAANFERVSLVAVPANILAAPLFGAVIVTSFLTSLAGLASDGLGRFFGRLAEVPLSLLVEIARGSASLPGASIDVAGAGLLVAVLSYAAIGLVALALAGRFRPAGAATAPRRIGALVPAALVVAVAALVVWLDLLTPDAGRLRVTVLDVGQGDAILITTPAGHRILVDGGPSSSAALNALGRELPSGAKRLDLVVLTHPQEDHVAGLVAVSQRYEVRAVADSGSASKTGSYLAWLAEIERHRTPVTTVSLGEGADLGHGVRLEVLGPPPTRLVGTRDDLNSNSIVLRLSYGSVSFLLTGDLSEEGEKALLAAAGGLQATVLKAGHHGSEAASSAEFLEAVRPAVAVISAGADNVYGHPSPTTLLRLAGTPVYRTDRNGSVRFETDGRHLFVKPERGSYQLVPISAR